MKSLNQRLSKLEDGAFDYLKKATDEELTRIAGAGPGWGILWTDVLDAEFDEMSAEIDSGGTGDIALAKVIARLRGNA
jgi:hypothetical protein